MRSRLTHRLIGLNGAQLLSSALHQALTSYKSHLFLHFFFISLFFHAEEGEGHIQAMISKSGDSMGAGSLFYHMGPGNHTGVIRLIDKYLYPPSHLWPDFYSS